MRRSAAAALRLGGGGAPPVGAWALPSAACASRSSSSFSSSPGGSHATVVEDDAHGLSPDLLPPGALHALLRLRREGHEAWLVGGTVRDLLLGRPPKDIDVLSSASLVSLNAQRPLTK